MVRRCSNNFELTSTLCMWTDGSDIRTLRSISKNISSPLSGPQMFQLTTPAGGRLSPRPVILYGRIWRNLFGLVLTNETFLNTVMIILPFAKMFNIQYGKRFLTARNNDIAEDLSASHFLHNSSCNVYLRHERLEQFFVWPKARSVVETEARPDFGITHLQDWMLLSRFCRTAVLLLRASYRYVINQKRR